MALVRPEGLFLATLMLTAVTFARGLKQSREVLLDFALVFLLVGGCYFFWRWRYFGYLLPNAFYRKGGGRLYWSSLEESAKNVLALSGPFALVYLFGLCRPTTAKRATFALIPIAGFTLAWILLSNAMNYLMRFQYPILPIVLISWPTLLEGGRAFLQTFKWQGVGLRGRKLLQVLAGALALWALSYRGEKWASPSLVADFNYDVAVILGHYSDKGYTLATSEAGVLPLYSKWRTIDTWGLNDPWIAHHGAITEQYLQQQKPEVIEFHASFSPVVPPAPDRTWPFPEAWYSMLVTVKRFAEENGYCLVAAYGIGPRDSYYYYVRRDFPDSAKITREIRDLKNVWKAVGWRVFDFAEQKNAQRSNGAGERSVLPPEPEGLPYHLNGVVDQVRDTCGHSGSRM
jgi:hypothetical protein